MQHKRMNEIERMKKGKQYKRNQKIIEIREEKI